MRGKAQVLAFFDKWQVEVPTSLYIGYEDAIERGLFRVPSEEEVEAAFSDASTTLMPATEDMAQVPLPLLAPLPPQWAEELISRLMTPIQVYRWLNTKLLGWGDKAKLNAAALRQWIRCACTRLENDNEEKGLVIQREWCLFHYTSDLAFEWAASRVNNITGI